MNIEMVYLLNHSKFRASVSTINDQHRILYHSEQAVSFLGSTISPWNIGQKH